MTWNKTAIDMVKFGKRSTSENQIKNRVSSQLMGWKVPTLNMSWILIDIDLPDLHPRRQLK
jgi:hypothetical protein